MFGFGTKKRVQKLENEIKSSFEGVKKDFEGVGKWIKHLDRHKKEHIDYISGFKNDLATIKQELVALKELISVADLEEENKQLSKKAAVLNKQTAVVPVQEPVQTGVQTGNFHGILNNFSSNERLLVFTLMNSSLKLSYEDLARLLGKERSTIRGQINTIKQKSEGLLEEIVEPNGKKRVFVSLAIREKLQKYAKVRVRVRKKYKKLPNS